MAIENFFLRESYDTMKLFSLRKHTINENLIADTKSVMRKSNNLSTKYFKRLFMKY
jgi:hypothetical protein